MSAIRAEQFPVSHAPPQLAVLSRPPASKLPPTPTWTVDQYIALETFAQTKFEYLDGEIYCMSGGTNNHSEIAANVTIEIGRSNSRVGLLDSY